MFGDKYKRKTFKTYNIGWYQTEFTSKDFKIKTQPRESYTTKAKTLNNNQTITYNMIYLHAKL